MQESSPDVILCGWLGSKYQLTNVQEWNVAGSERVKQSFGRLQHTACEQGMKISDTGLFIGLQQWQAIQPMHTRWTSFSEIVSMWLLFPFCPPCKFQSSSSNVCVCVREREVVSYYHDRQNITFDTLGCLQTARWM